MTTPNPVVFLNHCYRVVDKETYQAIISSPFIRDLFAFNYEESTSSDGDFSWSGFYLRGEDTYIEFFQPDPKNDEFSRVGNSGIGLGTDKKGDIKRALNNLTSTLPKAKIMSFTRMIKDEKRPWFKYLINGTDRLTDYLSLWVMEYEESYFASPEDVSRRRYNAEKYDKSKLLKNIVAIHLNVDQKDFMEVTNFLGELTPIIDETSKTVIFHFSEFDLYINQTDSVPSGITKIVMELNAPVRKETIVLGETAISLQDRTALWVFN